MNTLFLYQTQLGGTAGSGMGLATVSVTHAMTSAENPYAGNLGLHVGDAHGSVLARRAALERSLGMPIQWLNQVHGVTVHVTDHVSPHVPTADASITQLRTLALAAMTADCLPVAFTACNAAGQSAVGIAHAGWRGLLAGVLGNAIAALHAAVPNATVHAHLGPCIGVGQFEVGAEVRQAFTAQSPTAARHFTAKPHPSLEGKYLCDLESLARDALLAAGVQHLSGGGWCTVSDSRLASYRRQALTGRFATLIALNP